MKKTFTVEGTEYTVEEITAIATCSGEYSEDKRQNALLVTKQLIQEKRLNTLCSDMICQMMKTTSPIRVKIPMHGIPIGRRSKP